MSNYPWPEVIILVVVSCIWTYDRCLKHGFKPKWYCVVAGMLSTIGLAGLAVPIFVIIKGRIKQWIREEVAKTDKA